MTKCRELLEEFVRCKDVRRLDDLVREARAFLADSDTSCDAEKAVLREALEPLARLADDSPSSSPDSHCLHDGAFEGLSLGDARRARTALANTSSSALLAQGERQRKALGHALHLVEHNKANCARCREAHKRIRTALSGEE